MLSSESGHFADGVRAQILCSGQEVMPRFRVLASSGERTPQPEDYGE